MTLLIDWDPQHCVPLMLEAQAAGSWGHVGRGLFALANSGVGLGIDRALQLAERVRSALQAPGAAQPPAHYLLRASVVQTGNVQGFIGGRCRSAASELEAAIERYERTPGGGGTGARTLHVGVSARGMLATLWETSGQYGKLGRALVWQREARERGESGDVYSPRVVQYLLAADEVDAALAAMEAAVPDPTAGWKDGGMAGTRLTAHVHRWLWYLCEARARRASPQECLARWEADAEHHDAPAFWLFGGQLFLRLAAETTDAERCAEYLRRAEQCWANASDMSHLVAYRTLGHAQLHHLRGEHSEARALLEQLAADPDPETGAHVHLAALRRLGELEGGRRGAAMIADADERLQALGFKRPDRWTLSVSPAFGEPR
jgi:hypothetical protein